MGDWRAQLTEVDRVRQRTAEHVLDQLDDELVARLERLRDAPAPAISARLRELDEEWDIERVLIVNASSLVTAGALASLARRRLVVVPAVVGGFLLQHGLQGWCPPLAIFRRRSVRTRREIDLERYTLKVLRGDLGDPPSGSVDDALDLTVRR